MELTCRVTGKQFTLSEAEVAQYKKFGFEPLSECFEANHRHRMSFRAGRRLYRRKCDATGAQIVSYYHEDKPFPVYDREYWNGDYWDGMDYGQDFDFNRPFFEQFKELLLKVPKMALINVNPDNSDYCNIGHLNIRNTNSVDIDFSNENELCYALHNSDNCYNCRFTIDSNNCTDCAFVSDCSSCTDCILCTNLNKKQYCIENEQLTREEYEKRKKDYITDGYELNHQHYYRLMELRKQRIVKASHILNSEDSSGDYVEGCKSCHNCYDAWNSQDVRNAFVAYESTDVLNCDYVGSHSQNCYNIIGTIVSTNCMMNVTSFHCSDVTYCDNVVSSSNVFGCCGLKRKEYCILNKQYTKEQYEELVPRIIEHMKQTGEWGEFFPKSFSGFDYNDSCAHEWYPFTKEEALAEGFTWNDNVQEPVHALKTIPAEELPDKLQDIPDDVLNWALICKETGELFKLTPLELRFYREHNLPIPRLCPNARYQERMRFMNKPELYDRQCQKCSKDVQTTYAPDRPETVYCEGCYLKEVY